MTVDRQASPGLAEDGARPPARTTVAIITRNRRESLLHTLDRLAELPERPPVIVVDNGSDDGTADAVRAHPVGARVLRPGRNTGALGRTLAVRQARTPYVAFSDDDSWWAPGALATAARLLDEHPDLGLVAARTLVGPRNAEDPLNAVLAGSPLPVSDRFPGRPVLGFLACAAVVRRRAYLDVGGYHPLLFFGAEETLLAYDLAAAGWGVVYEPSLTAHHHPDARAKPGRSPLLRRNEALTGWLRRPPRVALRRTGALAVAAARGEPGAARALLGLLVRIPPALARRRPLPAHVEHAIALLERPASAPPTVRAGTHRP
ncbi:glycosyltransferase family 2 protein [Streptomyces niger]|uniref:glycosyltransferase family 2 protein n=1 Tax=Streptomyces niger TaxID=66373 RepID=UPI00069A6A97